FWAGEDVITRSRTASGHVDGGGDLLWPEVECVEEELAMPLTTTGGPGYYEPSTDNIGFWMLNGTRERQRCAVTLEALSTVGLTASTRQPAIGRAPSISCAPYRRQPMCGCCSTASASRQSRCSRSWTRSPTRRAPDAVHAATVPGLPRRVGFIAANLIAFCRSKTVSKAVHAPPADGPCRKAGTVCVGVNLISADGTPGVS